MNSSYLQIRANCKTSMGNTREHFPRVVNMGKASFYIKMD